jgi:hypothetical protein
MMQEKAMVSDALNTLNSGLKTYTDMISQTENQELRSALQQMRNEAEKSQYELYTIAKNKKYYQPAGQASQNEINNLKSTFSQNTGWSGSSGMSGMAGGISGSSPMSGTMAGSGSMSSSGSGSMGSSGTGSMSGSGLGMSETSVGRSTTGSSR